MIFILVINICIFIKIRLELGKCIQSLVFNMFNNSKAVSNLGCEKTLTEPKILKVQFSWKLNVLRSENNILKSGKVKWKQKCFIFVHPCHKKLW